jgi:cell shape-determining protein MreC
MNVRNVERELGDLKDAVGWKYSVPCSKSVEKVLGFDGAFHRSFLIISATHGESKPGGVVISSDGLVGVVHDVSCGNARVLTVSDSRFFVPVISESGKHAVMSGCSDGTLRSVAIHDDASPEAFSVGEMLYTSGEGGVFCVNIPVAKVIGINVAQGGICATPEFSPSRLGFVWVTNPLTAVA